MKKVLKFGGSSVAGPAQMKRVIDIVKQQPMPCVVVVSALGGITDQLKALAQAALIDGHRTVIKEILERHINTIDELLVGKSQENARSYIRARCEELDVICQGVFMLQELSERSQARLMSFGELCSSYIITEAIKSTLPDTVRLDARKLIRTDNELMKARVDMATTNEQIKAAAQSIKSVAVVPGFIAGTEDGVTSTLGRGGSDYTAAIFARALGVDSLDIYSDVSGMLTANPRAVPKAQSIATLSYNEAFELSHFGAKVLYPPAIQPAYESDIPVLLKNTFDPDHPGTRISRDVNNRQDIVTGISSIDEVAMVNLTGIGMVGVSGYSSRVFGALHQHGINVVMIAQSCSERGICIAVDRQDLDHTNIALHEAFHTEISSGRIDPIKLESELSIIALVGDGMKYRSGVSGRIFSVLGNYGINIRAIAQGSSESNISIIINSSDEQRALQILHAAFFENNPTQIHLFIAGAGTVGSTFISLLDRHAAKIAAQENYEFHIHGLANSRQMILSDKAIDPAYVIDKLKNSKVKSNLNEMAEFAIKLSVPNKIFVDNTASELTTSLYEKCMEHGIHVATCNKIVASGSIELYKKLLHIDKKGIASYRYETNVGAALPVIRTISNMVASGDKIHRIQAVLSGSLNYIYDAYDGTKSFVEVVREAGDLGFTEPNPMDDLGGTDVMRKIVILSRAAGLEKSLSDVVRAKDMPDVCLQAKTIDEVFAGLTTSEDIFSMKLKDAQKENKKLKYIAELDGDKLQVGLQVIDNTHPFYSLKGTDNMVAIYSDRYPERPLIIQGAGAGAEITAAGVLSDILSIDFVS